MAVLLIILIAWLALQLPVAIIAGRALARSTPLGPVPAVAGARAPQLVTSSDFRVLP